MLTNVNTQNIFVWNPFELASKKTVHFERKYAYKKFEKDKFKKKTEGILLLDITNLYFSQKVSCHFI